MLLKQKQFWQRESRVCSELKNGATVQVDMDEANRKYKKVVQSALPWMSDEQFWSRFFPSQVASAVWQRESRVCSELKNGATVQVDMDEANRKYKKVVQSALPWMSDEQFWSRFFPSQVASAVDEELEKYDQIFVYQTLLWPGHSGLVGVWRCFPMRETNSFFQGLFT